MDSSRCEASELVVVTAAGPNDEHFKLEDARKLHADRGQSGDDRRKTCSSNSGRAGVSSTMRSGRGGFSRCCASFRAAPPENPSLPVLFARQVDEAEKDYDETLFLSYRKGGLLSAPVTLGKETRRSLTPPVPSRLTFTLPIPAEPLLSFSIGVSTLGEQTLVQPVRFTIYVDEDIAFEETLYDQPNVWLPRTVDLSEWSGRTVRLGFETGVPGRSLDGTGSAFLPAWGNPVLDGPSANEDGTNLVLISVDCSSRRPCQRLRVREEYHPQYRWLRHRRSYLPQRYQRFLLDAPHSHVHDDWPDALPSRS